MATQRDGSPIDLNRVQRFLEERKALGYPVSRLLLQRCDTYERRMTELSSLVDEVKLVDKDTFTSCAHLKSDNVHASLYREVF